MIQRVKGTHDYLDLSLFNYIIERTRACMALHHFTPIMTPIIEPTELFIRSLGQHTDVVSKEMFVFSPSPGESICLRPEATASTARAFVENGVQQTPWKVYTWGPMFRHERPQKGRYRQFHQVSIEVIGSEAVAQDAQLISLLDRLFSQSLHFDAYALQLNFLGCAEDRAKFKLVLNEFLDGIISQICETCKVRKEKNILRVFDCKNPADQALYQKAPVMTDHLCESCAQEWTTLQQLLEALSVSFSINHRLVRGLDYYQKTVFEFVSAALGAQNTFCGGGRYSQLVQLVGAREDQPCIGAAFGIERLMMMLELVKDKLQLPQPPALQVIIPFSVAQHPIALLLAQELTGKGICTEVLFEGSLKSMMKQANKLGAQHVLIVGEDEQKEHAVMVKNMVTGKEEKVKQIDVARAIKG